MSSTMKWKNIFQLRRNLNALSSVDTIKSNAKTLSAIPGPKYYPILGSINEVLTMGKAERLHLTIDNYHKKYGSIFHARLGPVDGVFISSADEMRTVFAYEGKHPKHPIPPSWIYFNQKFDVQRGLIFMDGEEWLKHRQLLNIFFMRDFHWTEELIEMGCDSFLIKMRQSIIEKDASQMTVPDLEDELYRWSIDVILNLMLGSSFSEQSNGKYDEHVDRFSRIVRQVFDCSAKLLSVPPAFADKWNLKCWKDFERVAKESIELSRKLICILNNEMQSSDNGLLRKMKSQNLSDDIIVRLFSDLIIAAGDTTTNAILWCLHQLAKDVTLQSRIRHSLPTDAKEMEIPLVRACLREALRLYPVAPFIGRIMDTDAQIGDFTIPRGWMALLSMYTAGRDPIHFSQPSKFMPDRWLRDGNITDCKVFKPHASLPFAMSIRSCVGKRIATYQIHCLITKILQQFSMESLNVDEVNFKLKLIGVPDKKILIAFRNLIP